MEHAREIELIELAAQRLDAEQKKVVLAHLQNCPACRTKLEDLRKTWDLLGAWEVQPARHVEVAKPVVPSGSQRERPMAGSILRFPGIGTAVRIAAALAVAVLVGYAGGRWSIRPTQTRTQAQPPQYFSVLGFEAGDSFSSLVLQEEPLSSREG
jgi:anti-sigma factor RsiW